MSGRDNLMEIFEYALSQEKTGLSFFLASRDRLGHGAALDALDKLIREEEKHIEFITRILEDLREDRPIDTARVESLVIQPSDFFEERSRSEFLAQSLEASMIPDVTVFNVAWLIEKDLSEFYARAAEQAGGAAGDALRMLSRWEKNHERFFKAYRDRLTKMYAGMPWGG